MMQVRVLGAIAVIGGWLVLEGCTQSEGQGWDAPAALASGVIEQTATAGLTGSDALMVWSSVHTSEQIDSDQTGLNGASQTRYVISAWLTIEAAHSTNKQWSGATTLGTGAATWTRREIRDNADGSLAGVFAQNDDVQTAHIHVAADGSGNALAIWQQRVAYTSPNTTTRTISRIYTAKYSAGTGTWSTPTALDQATSGGTIGIVQANDAVDAFDPDIAMNSAGDGIAIWRQVSAIGQPTQIVARRYRPDLGWTAPQTISSAASGLPADSPRVAMAPDTSGTAFAVWRQIDTTTYNAAPLQRYVIHAARYASAVWSASVALNDTLTDASAPTIAVGASNNAAVAWEQNDYTIVGAAIVLTGTTSVYANRYATGAWLAAASAEELDGNTDSARAPDVALDANNRIHAIWLQHATPPTDIWKNDAVARVIRKTYTSSWGAAETLDTQTRLGAEGAHLLAQNGRILAYWQRWRDPRAGSGNQVLAQVFRNGAWEDTAIVSVDDDAHATSAAISGDGTAIIAWGQLDKSGSGQVMANRYR